MRHPKKPSEGQTKKAIKDWLRYKYLYIQINNIRPVHKPDGSVRFIGIDAEQRGAPDLLVFNSYPVCNGYTWVVALEIKSHNGKQSPDQKKWQSRAEAVGIEYYIVRSLEDVEKILG